MPNRLHPVSQGVDDAYPPSPLYSRVSLRQTPFEIRLLRIRPTHEERSLVDCTLHSVELTSAEKYEALSYRWTGPVPSKKILVNGIEVKVAVNLECALRSLRTRDWSRTLWCDALCINQQNNEERGDQVAQMHQIYKRAIRTVLWLGDQADHSDEALKLVDLYPDTGLAKLGGSYFDDIAEWSPARRALQALMERSIWKRLWIMQEVALSKREPRVYCGQRFVSWQHLEGMIDSLNIQSTHFKQLVQARKDIRNADSQASHFSPGQILRHVLELSSGFETTEPLDRIFALYGMLQTHCFNDVVSTRPNYETTVGHVYKMMTWDTIRLEGGLDLLEMMPYGQDPSLPSWVVDFSKTISSRGQGYHPHLNSSSVGNLKENADLDPLDSISKLDGFGFELQGDILKVPGVIVDTVSKTIYRLTSSQGRSSGLSTTQQHCVFDTAANLRGLCRFTPNHGDVLISVINTKNFVLLHPTTTGYRFVGIAHLWHAGGPGFPCPRVVRPADYLSGNLEQRVFDLS